ncbi:MAG: portal protein [Thermodesulfobacteriota bacterium]
MAFLFERYSGMWLIDRITDLLTKAKYDPSGVDGPGTTRTGNEQNGWYYNLIKLEETRKARYKDYDTMDDEFPEISCVTGDTIVHCLDGDFTIKELTENKKDEMFLVYSCDGNRIVFDEAYAPRLSGRKVKVIRVRYRSNNRWTHELRVTGDHKFMMRDGSMKMAGKLRSGDSLMPFNAQYVNDRRVIKDLDGRKVYASHLVFEQYANRAVDLGKVIHHIDGNRRNDNPLNLHELSLEEHCRKHSMGNQHTLGMIWNDDTERVEKHRKRMLGNKHKKGKANSIETRMKMRKAHAERRLLGLKRNREYGKPWNKIQITPEDLVNAVERTNDYREASELLGISVPVFFRRVKDFGLRGAVDYNHVVVGIEDGGFEDVYDLTTRRTHKFAANHLIISNSSIDIYSDNATQSVDGTHESFWIESEDQKVKDVLTRINEETGLQDSIWSIGRNLVKYGDDFEEIVLNSSMFVVDIKGLPCEQMYRNEDEYGRLLEDGAFTQRDVSTNKELAEFKSWQIVHFRNVVKRGTKYGRSLLYPARKVFKQLQMMEDGMVIARLTRSNMRYKWKIDVGNMSANEARTFLRDVKMELRKKRVIDPATGKFKLTDNPLKDEEDFFVAVRDGSPADVDAIQGSATLGTIGDVEYFQNKLFSMLKVPKAYLGLERDVNAKCLAGDTPICLANGKDMPIRELVKLYSNGQRFYVYSCRRDGEIVIAEAHSPRITRRNAEMVKVTLDSGVSFRCTPDHPIMLRSGSFCQAKDIKNGTSIMPLYRKISEKPENSISGYELHRNPRTGQWRYTHRLVGRHLPRPIGEKRWVMHHVDFDKRNNSPDNLVLMTWDDHVKLHMAFVALLHTEEVKKRSREGVLKSAKFKKRLLSMNSSLWKRAKSSKTLRRLYAEGVMNVKGVLNPRYRKDVTVESIANAAREAKCSSAKEIQEKTGINYSLLRRRLDKLGLSYQEFADKVLEAGYRKTGWHRPDLSLEKIGEAIASFATVKEAAEKLGVNRPDLYQICKRRGTTVQELRASNHKVVSVEPDGVDAETYDLTVDNYHTFAIGCGIFVHNSTLTVQDVQFARTVRRYQKILTNQIRSIYNLGLILQSLDLAKSPYYVFFPPINTVDELARWQTEKVKAEIAKIYGIDINCVSEEFILSYYLGLTDNEIKDVSGQTKPVRQGKEQQVVETITTSNIEPHELLELGNLLEALRDLVEIELEKKEQERWEH